MTENGPLVLLTKFASAPDEKLRRYRLERWELQAAARELLPDERVALCYRRLVPKMASVQVMYSPRVQRAHYKNLMVCGALWQCPICAAKISERRRIELSQAIDSNPHLTPVLATFTLQHDRGDKLETLLVALLSGVRFLKGGRRWARFTESNAVVGSVRSLEVTHGFNGWHPHFHSLFFFERQPDCEVVSQFLKEGWRTALVRSEQTASYAHGVDVRDTRSDIATYITKYGHQPVDLKRPLKWSMEHELTKALSKRARGEKGKTPSQLLADFLDGDRQAGRLWVEYARTFKGKQQLVWSRGLRKRLNMDTARSDEELANAKEEDAWLLVDVPKVAWWTVVANDARGELIEIASNGDRALVVDFLKSLGIVVE